jgi:ABC-2 type transport system permease protein
MIPTLLRIGWTNLRRDRVAQALTFVLPIVFFSIFANVFGGQADAQTARIRVAVVDEDRSELSGRLLDGLRREKGLRTRTTADESASGPALDRAAAERLVHEGDVPVAIVIPRGLGESFARTGFAQSSGPAIQLLADVSDRIAPQMVLGLLQKVTMTAAPDLVMQGGLRQFEQYAGAMTPQQKAAVESWIPRLRAQSAAGSDADPAVKAPAATGSDPAGAANGFGVAVQVVDVMRADSRRGSLVSFYAAGIGVMFLLFSSVAGAGGALLEEAEAGTLERLLSTNIGMTGLLTGKWLFLSLVGISQLTVMFLWGRVAFGLPLFSHLPGFAVMTVATAAAAAALGLVLATLARTRAQLSGFSTILILTMSALGGSMFPRFLMSERMQHLGLLTFNAWALDGYLKVFWRNAALWELWPQVGVLCMSTAAFLAIARLLARRWDAA